MHVSIRLKRIPMALSLVMVIILGSACAQPAHPTWDVELDNPPITINVTADPKTAIVTINSLSDQPIIVTVSSTGPFLPASASFQMQPGQTISQPFSITGPLVEPIIFKFEAINQGTNQKTSIKLTKLTP